MEIVDLVSQSRCSRSSSCFAATTTLRGGTKQYTKTNEVKGLGHDHAAAAVVRRRRRKAKTISCAKRSSRALQRKCDDRPYGTIVVVAKTNQAGVEHSFFCSAREAIIVVVALNGRKIRRENCHCFSLLCALGPKRACCDRFYSSIRGRASHLTER